MNPVIRIAELQLVSDLRVAWQQSQDVDAVLQILTASEHSSPLGSRALADFLMVAFSLPPVTIGLMREWRDGRMTDADFRENLREMIAECASSESEPD